MDELDRHGHTLQAIREGTILGAVVRGVYEPEQAEQVARRLAAHPAPPFRAEWPTYAQHGERPFELGMALFSAEGDLDVYFAEAARHRRFMDQEILHDLPLLEPTLERVLGSLGGGLEVQLARGPEDGQCFVPGTVRVMTPGGGLEIHVGLDLLGSPATRPLRPVVDTSMQLSYFLTLHAVEQGGELVIYDLQWPDVVARADDPAMPVKPGALVVMGDAAAWVRSLPQLRIKPGPGDLLVFNGGRWYHEVADPVCETRWTIGGFMAWSRDRQRLLYWA